MVDDMVMRSVYLRPAEDAQLRELAHTLNVTKSDLIRSAIAMKLFEWMQSNDSDRILQDVEYGKRDEEAIRSGRRGRRKPVAALPSVTPVEQAAETAPVLLPAPEPNTEDAPEGAVA
jgi:hypothetical protein